MAQRIAGWSFVRILVVVVAVAIGVRLALLAMFGVLYQPGVGDDVLYRSMATNFLQSGQFQAHGERPPLYPLLLAALWWLTPGESPLLVVLVQQLMGVLTTALWTQLIWRVTRTPWVTLLAGLLGALLIPALLLELRLLTEPLSTLLLVLSCWGLVQWQGAPRARWLLVCGLSLALLSLTRVAFALLPVVPWAVMSFQARWWWQRRAWALASLLLLGPSVLATGGWLTWQAQTVGRATLSTYDGYSLTNTVCAAMQDAPDQYATLRSIYLQQRAKQYERYGTCAMTIWVAYPTMLEQTGQSFEALSTDLRAMSFAVMRQRPQAYVRSVLTGSLLTLFEAPILADSPLLKLLYQPLHYLGVLLALLGVGVIITLLPRHTPLWQRQAIQLLLLLALGYLGYTVAVSSLLEFGENGRYRIPLDLLLHGQWLIAWWLWRLHRDRSQAAPTRTVQA